jgi:hypothetical protein
MSEATPLGLGALALLVVLSGAPARSASEYDYAATIKAIASDIAGLKTDFPQLRDFSATQNVLFDKLAIDYAYHTHRHRGSVGGWQAEAPNPDDDGVWLYIDFHDVDSTAQIHTQPVMPALCFGDKRAAFLLLEGDQMKPLSQRVRAILDAHGVKPCGN